SRVPAGRPPARATPAPFDPPPRSSTRPARTDPFARNRPPATPPVRGGSRASPSPNPGSVRWTPPPLPRPPPPPAPPSRSTSRPGTTASPCGLLVCLTGFALIQLEGLPQRPTGSCARSVAYWLHVALPVALVWLYVKHRQAGPAIKWRLARTWGAGVGMFTG